MTSLEETAARVRLLQAAALLTLALVAYGVWGTALRTPPGQAGLLPWTAALFCALALAVYYSTHPAEPGLAPRWLLIGVQYLLLVGLALTVGSPLLLILLVVIAGQLPWALSLRWALVAVVVASVASAVWLELYVGLADAWTKAGLYAGFQAFALFSGYYAASEGHARAELAQRNRELEATQRLLSETARQAERLRIARDLHDVAGHHLAALSLNLEVASHLTEGKAKTQVDQAREIARALLKDVRLVVETQRSVDGIDLRQAIAALASNLPGLAVDIQICRELKITDPRWAETLLRCAQEIITNTLRHSGAAHLELKLSQQPGWLVLEAQDDGRGFGDRPTGNGLRGMHERLRALGGDLTLSSSGGAKVTARLPRAQTL